MHNLNVEALEQTVAEARRDSSVVVQHLEFGGEWSTSGGPQFTAVIPIPNGEPVRFAADFAPPLGGHGSAPSPLAYCLWGGVACYAMTFAQEAARRGVELHALRAHVSATVDQSRSLGVTENPPVGRIDWRLDVDAGDTAPDEVADLKRWADDRCPAVFCTRNPIELRTHLEPA